MGTRPLIMLLEGKALRKLRAYVWEKRPISVNVTNNLSQSLPLRIRGNVIIFMFFTQKLNFCSSCQGSVGKKSRVSVHRISFKFAQ